MILIKSYLQRELPLQHSHCYCDCITVTFLLPMNFNVSSSVFLVQNKCLYIIFYFMSSKKPHFFFCIHCIVKTSYPKHIFGCYMFLVITKLYVHFLQDPYTSVSIRPSAPLCLISHLADSTKKERFGKSLTAHLPFIFSRKGICSRL